MTLAGSCQTLTAVPAINPLFCVNTFLYSRINSTKSPSSGAGNFSEPRLI